MNIWKKSLAACAAVLTLAMGATTVFAASAEPAGTKESPYQIQAPADASEENAALHGLEEAASIYAAGKGTVKEAGYSEEYGNYVLLDHGGGLETLYAHCRSVNVKTGGTVEQGQAIAEIDIAGTVSGPRLRYEVLLNGESVDPLEYQEKQPFAINSIRVTAGGNNYNSEVLPVCALKDGTILNTGVMDYGVEQHRGLFVEITYDGEHSVTFYGCESVLVKNGDTVKAGAPIARRSDEDHTYRYGKARALGEEKVIRQNWMDWAAENLVNGDYPRNSRGETYGNWFGYNFLGRAPDLIAAYSDEDGEAMPPWTRWSFRLVLPRRSASPLTTGVWKTKSAAIVFRCMTRSTM